MLKQRFIVLLGLGMLFTVVTACSGRSAYSTVSRDISGQPTAPPTLSLDEAYHTAANFLYDWTVDSYHGMYGLLTVNSRDATNEQDFQKQYTDAESTMTLLPGGKTFTVTNAILQGNTADVAYDMGFKTKAFGDFTDPARFLHLMHTSDGWQVAWSPGDIFAEMKDGAALNVQQAMPLRANIYDRDGQVIADENGVLVRLTLHTRVYPGGNPDNCFTELARVFKTRTADQMKKVYGSKTGHDYIYDVGELSQDALATERAALERVCTLTYTAVPTRRYVSGGLAPHIVGYVGPIPAEQVDAWIARGYSSDALVGIDGIERYREETLAGHGSATLQLESMDGSVRTLATRAAQSSQSIYLTIDRKLQQSIQDMFKDAYAHSVWGAWSTGAAAIVMDVHTGEIRAIASYPDFDVEAFNPNSSLKDAPALIDSWMKDPKKPTFNRATLGQYPLGSVFKIVSMAAAADSGKIGLNATYNCNGIWNGTPLGDRTRKDWLSGGHGIITLKQALTGSCDIYFWYVGWTLNGTNPNLLVDYARRMGFGSPTGIVDVGESPGALPDPANYEKATGMKWRGSDALNLVVGQGDIFVTPLQVVRMVAAVANGGTLYQPLLVEKTGIIGDISSTAQPVSNGKFNLKPGILEGIQQAMCDVTTNQTLGTATFVFEGFKGAVVCGKTGTAQAGGQFDQPHAWFAAYAGQTAENPDIAVVVLVEHSGEGSYVAAPLVRHIIELYYGMTPAPWPAWYGGGMPTLGSGD